MVFKVILVSLFFAGAYAGFTVDTRIVNGSPAANGEFPYAVSLRNRNSHVCGGTILNNKFVLTAAHCVKCGGSAAGYSIQYGSTKITSTTDRSVNVAKFHCNGFNSQTLTNDVSVLELASPIPAGTWKPVKIARSFDGSKPQSGTIIGWGKISHNGPLSPDLLKLNVNVYTDQICSRRNNVQHHICFGAARGGACNGDSGTALLINGVQAGIASYITATCGTANENTPNVYSRVPTYAAWIQKIAGNIQFVDI